ncbi:hypothetical protein NLJ89_g1741 [Agrocybe chaxingu]|uniref:NAD(P)-binding protein n=1 Tax=Agrocybe chaxingu TaxID=84603 RepID=A0A9W8MZI0_9AGAR|nr:hypothetical protein NLJ89_g1741 [Agrocybe chaxingu]
MSTTKVYVVANADRGIGPALVEVLSRKHEDIVIYAGACNPSNATKFKELASRFPGKVEITEVASGDESTSIALAKAIQANHGYVDVVIYNAGIANYMASASDVSPHAFREHLEVICSLPQLSNESKINTPQINATAVLVLYQAMSTLLKEGKSKPKFIAISTEAAHTNEDRMEPFGYASYSASKATLNYICRKIHYENSWLVAFPITPGVITTSKNDSVGHVSDKLFIPLDELATSIVKIVDGATREKEGGQFMSFNGTKLDW